MAHLVLNTRSEEDKKGEMKIEMEEGPDAGGSLVKL